MVGVSAAVCEARFASCLVNGVLALALLGVNVFKTCSLAGFGEK